MSMNSNDIECIMYTLQEWEAKGHNVCEQMSSMIKKTVEEKRKDPTMAIIRIADHQQN